MIIRNWDNATRTYTERDEAGAITLTRPYTTAENAAADQEAAQNAQLTDLDARVAALAAYVFGQVPPPSTATPWVDGTPIPPGGLVSFGGSTYKNISGAWLVASPSVYPNGWSLQGAPVTAWAVGVAYKVGDHVTYQGSTYQCLTAHTSQAAWDPADAPSLWQKL
jgi:hypothetical protein